MNKPVKTFRRGAVSAAIWSEIRTFNGNQVTSHRIKFERSYRSGNEWKYTTSFQPDDLLNVASLADEAHKYLTLKQTENKPADMA